MPEPRHALDKVRKCDVEGCGDDAERAVAGKKVEKAGLKIPDSSRAVHLCKKHYREYKKKTKTDRTFERLGW
jgi:hypothetical protein